MTSKFKNFIIRTVTSVLFVVVLVGCIVLSPTTFDLLFGVITAMTIWEFTTIVNKNADLQVNRFITTAAGTYLFLAMMAYNINNSGSEIFIPYFVSIIYLMVSELYFDRKNSIYNWAFSMMAQVYIALPLSLLNTLYYMSVPVEYSTPAVIHTPVLVLATFIFLWCSDAGAYCVGSLIGKHKLFPRISPAKSWEGSIGGGLLAIGVSQLIAYLLGKDILPETIATPCLSPLVWAGFAVVVVIFGTWGDLIESLLKRKLGIKDSGNILPGHGGMLDRFDSTLLAVPAVIVYFYTVSQFTN